MYIFLDFETNKDFHIQKSVQFPTSPLTFLVSFVVGPFVALQAVLVLVIDPLVADMLQIEVRIPI